jgi:hypothetical protein
MVIWDFCVPASEHASFTFLKVTDASSGFRHFLVDAFSFSL